MEGNWDKSIRIIASLIIFENDTKNKKFYLSLKQEEE